MEVFKNLLPPFSKGIKFFKNIENLPGMIFLKV